MPSATHEINFGGLAGSILWTALVASLFFIVGFATPGWYISGTHHLGLWQECVCAWPSNGAWQSATQAMETIGLILMVGGFISLFLYLFVHSVDKNHTLIATVVLFLASVLFTITGVIVFGAEKRSNLHFSFGFAIVASILTLTAAILGILQMRQAGTLS